MCEAEDSVSLGALKKIIEPVLVGNIRPAYFKLVFLIGLARDKDDIVITMKFTKKAGVAFGHISLLGWPWRLRRSDS